MKTLLTTLTAAILFASASFPARAQGSISVDFFYDNLSSQGVWLDVGDYGYAWQPNDTHSDWSPYSDGRWVYTEAGWTWDSNEPYGWAVYHYGRWASVRNVGWVWVPGTEWGPAWVSWRHSSSHVGWAPLPPEARFSVSIGFSSWVDSYYDIGPGHYRFVEGRNFGSRNLNSAFVDRGQNVTLINQTTNITNITYQNNVIHNGGPVYEDLARLSSEPISRYKLDRRESFDGDPRRQTPDQLKARVEGDSLIVAAPALTEGGASAPENVSKTVRDVDVDRGWEDAGTAEEIAAMKSERRAKSQVPTELPEVAKFQRSAERPLTDTPETGAAREGAKGKGSAELGTGTTPPRPVTRTDGPGSSGPDQPRRPEGKGTMPTPPTAGQPTTPQVPDPRNPSGEEKSGQPSPPKAPAPGMVRPGQDRRTTPESSRTERPEASTTERPDSREKGKANPGSVPPVQNPEAKPDEDDRVRNRN